MHLNTREIILKQYASNPIPDGIQKLIHNKLKLPDERLSKIARPRRVAALEEAIDWPNGPDQDNRVTTSLYRIGKYELGVYKPGKEAAPDYSNIQHYKACPCCGGSKSNTNNPNDMRPFINS